MIYLKISRYSILYHASILSLSGGALSLIGFIFRILLARFAGAEGMGVYRLALPVSSILISLSISGVRVAVTRFSADFSVKNDLRSVCILVRTSCAIFMAIFFAAAFPAFIFRSFIADKLLGDIRTEGALLVTLFVVFFSGFEAIFESLFLGMRKTSYTAASNFLEQISKVFIVLGLLYLYGRPQDHALTASLIALGGALSEIPVLIWLFSMYKKTVFPPDLMMRRPGKPANKESMIKRVFSIAFPVSIGSISTNLIDCASVVLLPKRLVLSGMSPSGAVSALGVISGMAVPLISLPAFFVGAMTSVIVPSLSQSAALSNFSDVRRKVRLSFEAVGLFALPLTFMILPLVPALSQILYKHDMPIMLSSMISFGVALSYYQILSMNILHSVDLQRHGIIHFLTGQLFELFVMYFTSAIPQINVYGYIAGGVLSSLIVIFLNVRTLKKRGLMTIKFRRAVVAPVFLSIMAFLFSRYFFMLFLDICSSSAASIVLSVSSTGTLLLAVLPILGFHPVKYYKNLIPKSGRACTE